MLLLLHKILSYELNILSSLCELHTLLVICILLHDMCALIFSHVSYILYVSAVSALYCVSDLYPPLSCCLAVLCVQQHFTFLWTYMYVLCSVILLFCDIHNIL